MKTKHSVVLFEVMLAVLISMVTAVYLFRAFGQFSKAGRKSMAYMDMAQCAVHAYSEFKESDLDAGQLPGGCRWSVKEEIDEGLMAVMKRVEVEKRGCAFAYDTIVYDRLLDQENIL